MNFPHHPNLRADLAFIADWIKPHARILDLGCGDGAMLAHLQNTKSCTGYGVELNRDNVLACIKYGLSVIQQNIDCGLSMFQDNSFDTVLCLSALQMLRHTEEILLDITRVGQEAIVSFPNFAHWPHRLALLNSRMPVSRTLPYQWYNTPNLRYSTIDDFADLARKVGLEVIDYIALHHGCPVKFLPKWRGDLAVFRLRKPCPD